MAFRSEDQMWLAACSLLLVGMTACSAAEPGVPGHAVSFVDEGPILVEYGRHWLAHGPGNVVRPDQEGAFELPSWARAAAAFVDTNRNGILDVYVEPSAACWLEGSGWSCTVKSFGLTVLRVASEHAGDSGVVDVGENIMVLLDSYAADGTPSDGARLCLAGSDDCATYGHHALGPAGNSGRAVSACAVNAVSGPDGVLDLDVAVDGVTRNVTVSQPEPMNPRVTLQTTEDGVIIRIDAAEVIQRAIAWTGLENATRIDWSTEQVPGSVRVDGKLAVITLPRNVQRCTECKTMLQVAHFEPDSEVDDVMLVSEVRILVETMSGS